MLKSIQSIWSGYTCFSLKIKLLHLLLSSQAKFTDSWQNQYNYKNELNKKTL